MIKAVILTVSDSCSEGKRDDESGQTVEDVLSAGGFEICERRIVADDREAVVNELRSLCDKAAVDVVLTTGGTGLGPRDITPEATSSVCERMVPGLSEMMRAEGLKKTKNAVLSRGFAGIRNKTLIVNLPGSLRGARESLEIILDVLPHAVDMMLGGGH